MAVSLGLSTLPILPVLANPIPQAVLVSPVSLIYATTSGLGCPVHG